MRKLFYSLIGISTFSFGQTQNFKPDLNIKTPEVGSLLKNIETPVSYNTGLPNVSIPIYQISEGDIKYPISVDYNSSGVKVNERAGWVGMGFNISQPQITRNIKGIADDNAGFIKETQYLVNGNYVDSNWHQAFTLAKDGAIDLESDEYIAILPNGESITFYFSQDRSVTFPYGEIIQVPHTNNKITPLFSTDGYINGWKVIITDGTEYTFSNGNKVTSTFSYSVINDGSLPSLDGKSKDGSYITSWMLTKIKSIKNNELNFTYTGFTYSDCNLTNQRRDVDTDQNFAGSVEDKVYTNYQKTDGTNFYLSSIFGNFGKVIFTLDNNPREDYIHGKKLNKITIQDKNNTIVNEYSFNYIFKTSDNPLTPIYSCGTLHNYSDLTKRMFLENIIVNGKSNAINKPKYSFSYNPIQLPHRFSYATDWWGFYNDELSNLFLVPTISRSDLYMPNRYVNPSKSQAGLLTEIIYPTGGITKLEYESNRGINDKPVLKRYDNAALNSGQKIRIDGINIIPSKKNILNFNTQNSTPISTQNINGGKKIIYEMPFTVGQDVIGYYYGFLNAGNQMSINFDLKIDALCDTCIYGDSSLPEDNSCSIYFKIIKDNVVLHNKLISGQYNGELDLKLAELNATNFLNQNYKLQLEIFTGNNQGSQIYSNISNSVNMDFSWEIIDPDLVTKIDNRYDIPVGGHRIKSIKNYEALNMLSLHKDFEYKDDNGIESGHCNFNLANLYRFSHVVYLNSYNNFPLQFYSGQPIIYTQVKEKQISATEIKESIYKYSYTANQAQGCYHFSDSFGNGGIYPCFDDPSNAMLTQNKLGNIKVSDLYYTTPNPLIYTKYIIGYNMSNRLQIDDINSFDTSGAEGFKYKISSFHKPKLSKSVVKDIESNGTITSETNKIYNTTSHLDLIEENNQTSENNTLQKTKYYYPQDLSNLSFTSTMITKNMIGVPVKTEIYRGVEKLNEQLTAYGSDTTTNNLLLPKGVYVAKFPNNLSVIPNGIGQLEKRISYDNYDNLGNITQYTTPDNVSVSIIYGYNQSLPVAKIENATYAQVSSFVTNLQTLSNGTNENTLITALDNFRTQLVTQVPTAYVTTYTHKPLIGVSTVTDPKGQRQTYHYDSFNRLQFVKDQFDNILSENEYYYRPN